MYKGILYHKCRMPATCLQYDTFIHTCICWFRYHTVSSLYFTIFSLHYGGQTGSGAQQTSYSVYTEGSFHGGKAADRSAKLATELYLGPR